MRSSIVCSVGNCYMRNVCVTSSPSLRRAGEFVLFHDGDTRRFANAGTAFLEPLAFFSISLNPNAHLGRPERSLVVRTHKGCVPANYTLIDGVGVAISRRERLLDPSTTA